MFHISMSTLLVNHLGLCTYSLPFSHYLFWEIGLRMSNYNNNKIIDIMMHHNLTIGVIIKENNHQWKMIILKLLVQGLHWIEIFTNWRCHYYLVIRSILWKLKYISCIYFFSEKALLIYLLLIFIEHQ